MKKIFLSFPFLIFAIFTPLFAEQGILFDVGVESSVMLKPYIYEQVSYIYKWDFGFFLGGDVRVMENIYKISDSEPIFYFMGGPCLGYKNYYFSGGVFFYNNMESIKDTFFYIRTGYRKNFWQWGIGKGGLDIALEVSPTLYIVDTEEDNDSSAALGAGIASVFSSMLNLLKLNVGVTYLLPF